MCKCLLRGRYFLLLFLNLTLVADAPAGEFGKWLNRQSLRNTTGQPANDLRVVLEQPAKPVPTPVVSALPNTTLLAGGTAISAAGGTVADGQEVFVTWASSAATNRIVGGAWSQNGTDIGPLETQDVKLIISDAGLGQVHLAIDNRSGGPLAYEGLAISTGVDISFFNSDDFIDGMSASGTPISLLVPASGTLNPGLSSVAQYVPAGAETYSVGVVEIGNQFFAEGISLVPEPNGVSLAACGVVWLLSFRKRRQ